MPLSFTEVERQALEAEFGDGLEATLFTAVSALRPVVLRLINAGATRSHLVQIGVARGYKPVYVRTVVSQILVRVPGGRKRKSGSGPKTPQLACAILAFARELAGDQARKYLLAAAHLARIEDERRAAPVPDAPPAATNGPAAVDPITAQAGPIALLPLIYKS